MAVEAELWIAYERTQKNKYLQSCGFKMRKLSNKTKNNPRFRSTEEVFCDHLEKRKNRLVEHTDSTKD